MRRIYQCSSLTISITTASLFLFSCGIVYAQSSTTASQTGNSIPSSPRFDVKAVPGAYIPLREHLARLGKAFSSEHIANTDLPDGRFFLAVGSMDVMTESRQEGVRAQLSQLLTGPKWLYLWKLSNKQDGVGTSTKIRLAHLLTRRGVTDEDRNAEHIKEGMERLHYLASLVKGWPAQKEAVRDEDPDLASNLDSAFVRGRISLLSSLPADTVSRALGGETIQMPMSSLSAEQKGYIQDFAGHVSSSITDAQGHTRIGYDPKDINETGTLQLSPRMMGQSPDVSARIYSNINDPDAFEGGPVLTTFKFPEPDPRRGKAAMLREAKSSALLSKITGVSTVTIDKNLALAADTEPPLSAYLRSFASQTGLTILGRWPDPQTQASDHAGQELARLYNRRLSASIVNRPLAEALDTLCTIYNAHWVLDDGVNVKPTVGVNDSSLDGADPADAADPKKAHIIRFWADPPKGTATPKTAQN